MSKLFGNKVHALRIRQGLTLDELAEQTGSSKSYVWELENKPMTRPSAEKIFKLAEALETSPDFLMDDTQQKERKSDKDRAFYKKYLKMDEKGKRLLRCVLNSYLQVNK